MILNEVLSLASDGERRLFLNHKVVYSRPVGAQVSAPQSPTCKGVDVDTVQVVTGASEALLVLMWLAAERRRLILPQAGFPDEPDLDLSQVKSLSAPS
jgi:hypothetical protein